jgi:hypothetical protein
MRDRLFMLAAWRIISQLGVRVHKRICAQLSRQRWIELPTRGIQAPAQIIYHLPLQIVVKFFKLCLIIHFIKNIFYNFFTTK